MTIATQFNTPTTGFNDRAEALLAAALAASTDEAREAVRVERASLASAIIACMYNDTDVGANQTEFIDKWAAFPAETGYDPRQREIESVQDACNACARGDANGVTAIAALEARYAARAA